MEDDTYPNDDEIKRILWRSLWSFRVVSISILICGAILDIHGIIPNALGRAGGLAALLSVVFYFYLEQREFLTGHKSSMFDSGNHAKPREYVGGSIGLVAIVGTALNLFADLVMSLFKCGAMSC